MLNETKVSTKKIMQRRGIIILLFLVLFIGIIPRVMPRLFPAVAPPPTPQVPPPLAFGKLTAGDSKLEEVEALLGLPLYKKENVFYYSSGMAIEHQVIYKDGVAVLIKERKTKDNLTARDEMQKLYGKENLQLYGEDYESGLILYVVTQRGIAYLANPMTNTVFEVWYFSPTDASGFMASFSQGYGPTPQPGRF